MTEVTDNQTERANYYRAWQSDEARLLLAEHTGEQLAAGIYQTFLADMPAVISELYGTKHWGPGGDKVVRHLTDLVMNSEYPLVVMADSCNQPTDHLEYADPLGLIKANPKTGRSVRYRSGRCPFLYIGEVRNGVFEPDKEERDFTSAQQAILYRHAQEQITVGLHPQNVYKYTWF